MILTDLNQLDQAWNKHFKLDQVTPQEEQCPDCGKPISKCVEYGCSYYNEENEEEQLNTKENGI